MQLLQPLALGALTAPNRVMFGPLVTNLGDDDRRFTSRHTAFYRRRARGGCGVIVTEGASVHDSDWPYERAPLAERCGDGWAAIVSACAAEGALVVASLDHAGGQGSSAYHQSPLWAPSRVPEVNSREVPKWMEVDDIAAVVQGFGSSAKVAAEAGCHGLEINAGQHSLVRQFLSGLTNHRGDEWGADRLLFARQVIAAVRGAAPGLSVGLRLSCDELAPWAGITPEMAPDIAAALVSEGLDYLVVVRGSIFSVEKTRADFHEPMNVNRDVCSTIKAAVGDTVVFLQGAVVNPTDAEAAIADGVCDAVEMTRAQLADPDLVAKLRADQHKMIRPCIRCNQTCQVRDARNPIVTCVGEPTSGRETQDPDWYAPTARPRTVAVIGGGVAGMETARVAALRGHIVHLMEQSDVLGGLVAVAGPGAPLAVWLTEQVEAAGVHVHLGVTGDSSDKMVPAADVVVQCTGSIPGVRPFTEESGAVVIDIADVRRGLATVPDGPIAIFDPIGGPIGVAIAEELGERAFLITQDQIAGNELSRTGDLAPANVRLAQRGVAIVRRSILRAVRAGQVEVENRFTGERTVLEAAAVIDCGFRLPTSPLPGAQHAAGDCVAPRTIHESILEARRVALSL